MRCMRVRIVVQRNIYGPDPTLPPPSFLIPKHFDKHARNRNLDHEGDRMSVDDYLERCKQQVLAEYGAFFKEVCNAPCSR